MSSQQLVIPLNARVRVTAGIGHVRFVGQTAFAPGKWVGVELDGPGGKNDGSVAGTRYFSCAEGCGVFVKDRMVTVLDVAEEAESPSSAPEFKVPALPSASSSRPISRAAGPRPSSAALTPASSSSRPSSRPSLAPAGAPRPPSSASGAVRRPSSVASSTASHSLAEARASSPVKPPTSTAAPSSSRASASSRPSSSASTSRRASSLLPPPSPRQGTTTSRPTGLVPPTPRSTAAASAGAGPTSTSRLARPTPSPSPSPSKAAAANFAPARPRVVPATPTSASSSSGAAALRTPGVRAGLTTPLGGPGASASSGAPGGSAMRRQLSGTSAASSSSSAGGPGAARTLASRPRSAASVGEGAGATMRRTLSAASARSGGAGGLERERERVELGEEEGQDGLVGHEAPDGAGQEVDEGRQEEDAAASDPFSLKDTGARGAAKAVEATVPQRQHDELLAKLSILERRRAEDRERLRELDGLRDKASEWERVREKTRARVAELAGEVKELKRENKDLAASRESAQSAYDDLAEQVEHSLLDKEIAESELDEARARLKELEERVGEVEVEVEVVKEENARLEGLGDAEIARSAAEGAADGAPSSASAPSSLAFRQLEKQNARLKDALVRLRDLTAESEAELKRKVESMEKELDLSADLQGDLDNMAVELEEAEAKIEDLKAQLDIAAEAQDMLEELTERNMKLHDDNEILKADVDELEALRELADELEESHLETEKQLQDEIDRKDLHLQELRRRNNSLEDACVDYEGTISQFRELVLSLQTDLDQLHEHQATQANESQSLTSQSQAMLNLNLKLQSTVLKSQVKVIDLELRKLEAQQAAEHLSIVKPYLLPSFADSDADAVDALLFFERIAYKVDLVNSFIEQSHSVSEALDDVVPEELGRICEARAKLAHFAALNKRFAAHLQRCPPDVFLKMGRVYREVAGIERRVDSFIEALRKEELRESECGKEVDGFIAQAEHLAETHLQGLDPTLDLAERELASITTLDLDFDTIAAASGFVKQTIASISRDPDVEVELGGGELDDALFKPLQNIVNHARNAKVLTKKLLRRFDDLGSTSSALSVDHAQGFETLAFNSSTIAGAVLKLASDVQHYCAEVRSTKAPLQLTTLHGIAKDIAAVELGKQSPRPLDEINALLDQLAQNVGTTVTSAMEPEHVVKLSFEAPWVARVVELQSSAAINVDAERKVVQLQEELRELVRDVRVKEQAHQEATVKIELMEKRLEGVKKQAEALAQLEGELAKSRKQERAYEEATEVLQRDLDKLEQELDKLKQSAAAAEKQGTPTSSGLGLDPSVYEGNMETSYLVEQITSLRSAVRFLRQENAYIKSHDLLVQVDALPSYDLPPTPPLTPEPHDPLDLASSSPFLSSSRAATKSLPPPSFVIRSAQLLREARLVSATPRLVDVSRAAPGAAGGSSAAADGRKPWQPVRRDPRSQLWAEKERTRLLERKVQRLWDERPRVATMPRVGA
ncbi:hypothetical protein JCM8208_000245 [Rhodotorula glutinis]